MTSGLEIALGCLELVYSGWLVPCFHAFPVGIVQIRKRTAERTA